MGVQPRPHRPGIRRTTPARLRDVACPSCHALVGQDCTWRGPGLAHPCTARGHELDRRSTGQWPAWVYRVHDRDGLVYVVPRATRCAACSSTSAPPAGGRRRRGSRCSATARVTRPVTPRTMRSCSSAHAPTELDHASPGDRQPGRGEG